MTDVSLTPYVVDTSLLALRSSLASRRSCSNVKLTGGSSTSKLEIEVMTGGEVIWKLLPARGC